MVFGRRKRKVLTPAQQLAQHAFEAVLDEDGVRVEEYVAVLAAATGEAAIVSAGLFDIENNDMAPGSGLFGAGINTMLSGDLTDPAAIAAGGPTSIVGLLIAELVPDTVPVAAFDVIPDLYEQVAGSMGSLEFGEVEISVPEGHRPFQPALRYAFQFRPAVDHVASENAVPDAERYRLCAAALAEAIRQTSEAIDVRVAVRLALDVIFGVAKRVPVPGSVAEE